MKLDWRIWFVVPLAIALEAHRHGNVKMILNTPLPASLPNSSNSSYLFVIYNIVNCPTLQHLPGVRQDFRFSTPATFKPTALNLNACLNACQSDQTRSAYRIQPSDHVRGRSNPRYPRSSSFDRSLSPFRMPKTARSRPELFSLPDGIHYVDLIHYVAFCGCPTSRCSLIGVANRVTRPDGQIHLTTSVGARQSTKLLQTASTPFIGSD
jgi:hypothetical protein